MQNVLVSINIVTLGRSTIYKTLESIYSQKFSYPFEINLILQGHIDLAKIKSLNIQSIPTHIHTYSHGLGFGYYRNQAIAKSHGDILVWIDDDEWTKDNQWLTNITSPIINNSYTVVTGGYSIGLGKGYLADCISLLGYPGGGALGFEKMWSVNGASETTHICTGNFAFHKSVISKIGLFNSDLSYGAEDVAFGDKIVSHHLKILYAPSANVFHIHRSGLIVFCKWHFVRGKASYQFLHLKLLKSHHKKSKLISLKNILYNPSLDIQHMLGVWFLFVLQYFCQGLGYLYYSIFKH